MTTEKILVIGAGKEIVLPTMPESMEDIVVIDNRPISESFVITSLPRINAYEDYADGKTRRRERRKKERKSKR